jgi:hypothetical protein
VFRDPEAEVRGQPHDLTLHESRKGVLYYTNTEANRLGALLEKPRQRLVQDKIEDAEASVGNTLLARSHCSGGSPRELARQVAGAGGAQIPTSVTRSSGGRECHAGPRQVSVQVEVETPKDERYLDLVLDGRTWFSRPPA